MDITQEIDDFLNFNGELNYEYSDNEDEEFYNSRCCTPTNDHRPSSPEPSGTVDVNTRPLRPILKRQLQNQIPTKSSVRNSWRGLNFALRHLIRYRLRSHDLIFFDRVFRTMKIEDEPDMNDITVTLLENDSNSTLVSRCNSSTSKCESWNSNLVVTLCIGESHKQG